MRKKPQASRLTPRERDAKKRAWDRQGRRLERGPTQVNADTIPDDNDHLIAVQPDRGEEVLRLLVGHGFKALLLGAVDQFCGRRDHLDDPDPPGPVAAGSGSRRRSPRRNR